MTTVEHTATLRKRKGLSQSDLVKAVGTSGDIIGKSERDEIKLSIKVASKIADALEVSLYFLLGKTSAEFDKKTLKRLQDIQKLPEEEHIMVFKVIDSPLRDFKAKQAYS